MQCVTTVCCASPCGIKKGGGARGGTWQRRRFFLATPPGSYRFFGVLKEVRVLIGVSRGGELLGHRKTMKLLATVLTLMLVVAAHAFDYDDDSVLDDILVSKDEAHVPRSLCSPKHVFLSGMIYCYKLDPHAIIHKPRNFDSVVDDCCLEGCSQKQLARFFCPVLS
ncbi:hypothetical protein L596_010614 [Steinernema carpocapsae]|uniref:Insulin-like domain-containing protein n=1 Tax=Steinernema carpocapsae TaxID=34508 RepID=A0A4U5PJ24_STECR|nr:hypothetical protein L596_010614 [Steinernema carpocapsae]